MCCGPLRKTSFFTLSSAVRETAAPVKGSTASENSQRTPLSRPQAAGMRDGARGSGARAPSNDLGASAGPPHQEQQARHRRSDPFIVLSVCWHPLAGPPCAQRARASSCVLPVPAPHISPSPTTPRSLAVRPTAAPAPRASASAKTSTGKPCGCTASGKRRCSTPPPRGERARPSRPAGRWRSPGGSSRGCRGTHTSTGSARRSWRSAAQPAAGCLRTMRRGRRRRRRCRDYRALRTLRRRAAARSGRRASGPRSRRLRRLPRL